MIDLDVLPSKDLYMNLKTNIKTKGSKSIFVVQAFHTSETEMAQVPQTKEEVVKLIEENKIQSHG